MKQSTVIYILTFVQLVYGAGINEVFTWTRISYVRPRQSRYGYGGSHSRPSPGIVFPDDMEKFGDQNDRNEENSNYIYENNIPMGANRWRNKLFITVPRRRQGVISSLNYVDLNQPQRHNVPLIPYPNWDINQLDYEEENRIVSVYRVAVDPCDRIWMIDTGIMEIPGNLTRIQPQAIVIIDAMTDKVIHRYILPPETLTPATILALITVDVTKQNCDDAYAYIPDLAGYGLIVYSLKNNEAWRVAHNYFYLEPTKGEFHIGGHRFQWNDGIFSIALSNIHRDGYRHAYFHAMAGTNMYRVSTRILRNRTLATRSYHGDDFEFVGDRGPDAQTSASAIHQQSGVFFLSLVNQNALGCWNINKPFRRDNFVVLQRDNEKMIYPSDVKIYNNDVILLTNNMPIFLYGTLNYDEVNFRVWISSVQDAVKHTKCE